MASLALAASSFAVAILLLLLASEDEDDVVVEYELELLPDDEEVDTSFGGDPLLESKTAGAQSPVLVD